MSELALVLRIALAELFVLSGGLKLLRFRDFRTVVEDYRVLPAAAGRWVAGLVVTAELGAAAGLAAGGTASRAACVVLVALLAAFVCAMAVNLRRGRRIRCGCFGADSAAMVSWRSVARNVLLTAAAVVVLLTHVGAGATRAWGGVLPSAVIGSVVLLTAALVGEVRTFAASARRLGQSWTR